MELLRVYVYIYIRGVCIEATSFLKRLISKNDFIFYVSLGVRKEILSYIYIVVSCHLSSFLFR